MMTLQGGQSNGIAPYLLAKRDNGARGKNFLQYNTFGAGGSQNELLRHVLDEDDDSTDWWSNGRLNTASRVQSAPQYAPSVGYSPYGNVPYRGNVVTHRGNNNLLQYMVDDSEDEDSVLDFYSLQNIGRGNNFAYNSLYNNNNNLGPTETSLATWHPPAATLPSFLCWPTTPTSSRTTGTCFL